MIHPIHGAYCKYKKDDHRSLSEIEGKFFELSRLLGHNQIPYHYGDEWMMQRMASVENGKITVGQCTYDTVIIPFTYSLDASTAALLKDFIAQGGKIWLFDRKPDCIDGVPADCSWLEANMTREELFGVRRTVITKNGKGVPQLRHMTRLTDDGILVYITNITPNTLEDVHVQLPETGFPWAKLNLYIMELEPVYIADGTAVLSFTDSASFVLVSGQDIDCAPLTEKPALPRTFIPVPKTVKLAAHPTNVLTLDTASRSNDGITYDEPLSVMGIKDNLLREQYSGKVFLKFTFTLEYQPKTLKAVLEPMYERVTVNGTEITPDKNDWWFDKSFASAEIAHLVHEGRNEIVVEVNHWQNDYVYYVLYSDVSESLRNCLVFDTEIESMFLIGDFAVKCDGTFEDGPRNSICFDGKFSLTAQPDTVPANDVVEGGFPFFGGRISTEFTYNYTPGGATVLNLDGRFSVADITVNGQYAGKMFFSHIMDLSDYLFDGKNVIGVTLCNSMRNTHGPHHRHDPEPYGVGPTTFSFEKEWNGRECKSYHDRYAFVKFGLKK